MTDADPTLITHGTRFAVAELVRRRRCEPADFEHVCQDMIVKALMGAHETPRLTRVVEDVVHGAVSAAGPHRDAAIAGSVTAAIRGGHRVGLKPFSAAVVAIESAATGGGAGTDLDAMNVAVSAALRVADQMGPPFLEELTVWLEERLPATPHPIPSPPFD